MRNPDEALIFVNMVYANYTNVFGMKIPPLLRFNVYIELCSEKVNIQYYLEKKKKTKKK